MPSAATPALDARMDEVIALIARVQRPDGYIHTPVIIAQRPPGDQDAAPFQDRMDFEMYNMGHLMTAACAHHEATGKRTLLDVAEKAAAFLDETFAAPTPELARNAVCPSHYMGLVDLYRATGKRAVSGPGGEAVEMRDADAGRRRRQPGPHPVPPADGRPWATPCGRIICTPAWPTCSARPATPSLLPPLEAVWETWSLHKMHVTGGCGALYDGASPDGAKDQKTITRVHQAYGREYQLPNLTAYNETCANIGNALWNWRMLRLTGEARFADVVERVLYNSVLSGISLDGKRFFYTNPLKRMTEHALRAALVADARAVPLAASAARPTWSARSPR